MDTRIYLKIRVYYFGFFLPPPLLPPTTNVSGKFQKLKDSYISVLLSKLNTAYYFRLYNKIIASAEHASCRQYLILPVGESANIV